MSRNPRLRIWPKSSGVEQKLLGVNCCCDKCPKTIKINNLKKKKKKKTCCYKRPSPVPVISYGEPRPPKNKSPGHSHLFKFLGYIYSFLRIQLLLRAFGASIIGKSKIAYLAPFLARAEEVGVLPTPLAMCVNTSFAALLPQQLHRLVIMML